MLSRVVLASLFALSLAAPAWAQEPAKPDDTVTFDLSVEDWVTSKTAHVLVNVEAAVNASNAGAVRADMAKAVNDAAKADWRLTSFNRNQDQTGMERWSVTFDTRLPESALNSLSDSLKKASKAGMQLTVSGIDFAPTLDETEAAQATLRTRIYKEAGEQLTALNGALLGRTYRIGQIAFEPVNAVPFRVLRGKQMMLAAAAPAAPETADNQEHAQKLALTAHIVFAALPPNPVPAAR